MYGAVVTAEPGDDTGLDEVTSGELGESINPTRVGIHPATSEDPGEARRRVDSSRRRATGGVEIARFSGARTASRFFDPLSTR